MVGYGDSMQIVGPLGNASESYFYWASFMDPTGTVTTDYFWADESLAPVEVSFDSGEGIAIDNVNGLEMQITNAGEVPEGRVSFAARADLNWSGNPFPAPIDISAINLDDKGSGMVGYGDSMQIVGPLGNASESYFYWASFMDPTGTVTTDYFWADESLAPATKTLNPGDGFAIDNVNALEFDITIDCPYSLAK